MKQLAIIAATALSACVTSGALPNVAPGFEHYRYQLLERMPGQPDNGYRLDFDLATRSDHSVVLIARHAERLQGSAWTVTNVEPSCATALHAQSGEMARIALWPPSGAAGGEEALDTNFMDACAPEALFYPVTDILNAVVVQRAPSFQMAALHRPGDHARTDAYSTHFTRFAAAIQVAAPGGLITFVSHTPQKNVVTWASDPMNISIHVEGAQPTTLSGVENYALQLEFDPNTGTLQRSFSTSDQLDLAVSVPGMDPSQAPHVHIVREFSIERTP